MSIVYLILLFYIIYILQRLFELNCKEHRGKGYGKQVGNRLGKIYARGLHSLREEDRHNIDKWKQKHELTHYSNNHRGQCLAERYKGHLAGYLYTEDS